jgi:small subunit ribosomal protein S13
VDPETKVEEWTDDEQARIRQYINDTVKVEGALRSEVQLSIKRLMDIGSYRGQRAPRGSAGAWSAYPYQQPYP